MLKEIEVELPWSETSIKLNNLSRINVFAGRNDCGKSYILFMLAKKIKGCFYCYSHFEPWLDDECKEEPIRFIRENFIPTLEDVIEERTPVMCAHELPLYGTIEKNSPKNMELDWGSGVSRMFMIINKIVLTFYRKNKYIFIDDFDLCIDTDTIDKFVVFIHELLVKYDMQLFLVAHSKECIDAFATLVKPHSDMCYVGVVRTEEESVVNEFEGENFSELVEIAGVDLRRTRSSTQTRCFEGLKYTTLLNVADADLRKAK